MTGLGQKAAAMVATPSASFFFVSDGTAITAETMGASIITRFDRLRSRQVRIPFVDTPEKAREAVRRINEAAVADGARPIVFTTLVNAEVIRELAARRGEGRRGPHAPRVHPLALLDHQVHRGDRRHHHGGGEARQALGARGGFRAGSRCSRRPSGAP
jgi:hypothetical protein